MHRSVMYMCRIELALNVKIITVKLSFLAYHKDGDFPCVSACIINFATSSSMISSGDTIKRNAFDHDAVTHKSPSPAVLFQRGL